MDKKKPNCSFCGNPISLTKHLIKGIEGKAHICDVCIKDCESLIEEKIEEKTKRRGNSPKDELTPEKIVAHLDEHVVGQTDAKKLLAIAIYNHYKRVNKKSDVEIQKSNVLLVGPTGSGKTHLVKHLAKLFDVPFAQADATTLTEAGYVGDDVDQMLAGLVIAAGGDLNKAQRGIIYIDEVDKIAASSGGSGRDVRGEGVQQSLLKMLEGTTTQVNPQGGKKNPQSPTVEMDTTNILFICAGAFSCLTDVTRMQNKSLGLGKSEGKDHKAIIQDIKPRDLVKYGMIPEFIGRLPIIARLDPLKSDDLVKILTEPKNSIVKQYQALFAMDGIKVHFTDEFLKAVAERAFKEGTGARGLRAIMEDLLKDEMFYGPSRKVTELTIGLETIKPSLTVVS